MKHLAGFAAGLLGIAALATAQAKSPGMVFPSDSPPAAAGGAAGLLESVCPGKVLAGKAVACKGACPASTGFAGTTEPDGWWVSAVTRGHFLSPSSDDAALAMAGCEPHAANFGGTVLLTSQAGGWKMRWYKAGLITDQCHKLPREDGRDLLVCSGGWTGQGITSMSLFLIDLAAASPEEGKPFFRAEDSTGACGGMDRDHPGPIAAASIDKVAFLDRKTGGLPAISVTASFGRKAMTPAQWQSCIDGKLPPTPVKTYNLEFQFDGREYKPVPASAAAARLFEEQ